jgi:hypothetical protein
MNRDRGSEEIGDQCIAQETARKIWESCAGGGEKRAVAGE